MRRPQALETSPRDTSPDHRPAAQTVLEVRDLKTHFHTDHGVVRAVDGVSLTLRQGKTLCVVGESGCGKSQTAFSILGLVPRPGKIAGGQILLHDSDSQATTDLVQLKPGGREIRRIRGNDIAMVFQEPMSAFSPLHSIGSQILEARQLHGRISKGQAKQEVIETMRQVGIPDPQRRYDQYPHEMSGGLRQRTMIAMALVCRPRVLIADEPTTALDVTIQAQILDLLRKLQQRYQMSVMLITHDLGVVAQVADEVAVMYRGRVIEHASVSELFENPQHPYTHALLRSVPDVKRRRGGELQTIRGAVPDPYQKIPGCSYAPRCEHARRGICDREPEPELRPAAAGGAHLHACRLRHEHSQEWCR